MVDQLRCVEQSGNTHLELFQVLSGGPMTVNSMEGVAQPLPSACVNPALCWLFWWLQGGCVVAGWFLTET